MQKLTLTTIFILITALTATAQVQYMEPFWIATGTSDTTELGESIAGIGDINQDGYDDFAVSTAEERVWIFLGSSLPDSIPDILRKEVGMAATWPPRDRVDGAFIARWKRTK